MQIIWHNICQNPYKTLCFCTPRRANLGPAGGLDGDQKRKFKLNNNKKSKWSVDYVHNV